MSNGLREDLSTITFRPTLLDVEVIKGLRGYLMEQKVVASAGNVSDAIRFGLHMAGLVLQAMVEGHKGEQKVCTRLLKDAHQVLGGGESL